MKLLKFPCKDCKKLTDCEILGYEKIPCGLYIIEYKTKCCNTVLVTAMPKDIFEKFSKVRLK